MAAESPAGAGDGPAEPTVSIVVPTLDEADQLPGLLDHLAAMAGDFEVVVVDGGSRDDTVAIARSHRLAARLVRSPRGRARQLNTGAARARGRVLVFLHADTRLPPDAVRRVAAAVGSGGADGGNFELAFDGGDWFSAVIGAFRRFERRLGVYYGDSVIFCRSEAFTALGGYARLPLMEDYDFARRLERGYETVCLPGPAVTSARRWKRMGVARTVVTWTVIRWLWLAGVPAERLERLYPHLRGSG